MYVYCTECGEYHSTEDLPEVTNCEEGPLGQDIITYVCPNTGRETKAVVFRDK